MGIRYEVGKAIGRHRTMGKAGREKLKRWFWSWGLGAGKGGLLMEAIHKGGGRAYLALLCPHWSRRVAYQYLGYKGYRYILERDRHGGEFRNYSEFSTQAHSGQLQSIRRVQQQAPWPQHLPRGSSLKAPEPPCPSCLFLGVLFYDLHPHLSEGPSLST